MVFAVTDRTQNVLIPLPCPLCGARPIIREPESEVLQSIAEIVCSRSGHSAAAYGKTVGEALAIWNTRPFPVEASTEPLPRESLEIYRIAWNDNRGPLPQATKLTGQRLDKLRRRIKEGLTLEEFTRAAWICSHTQFLLHGTAKQEFHATFDWLLGDSGTVTRVLDGSYGPTGKTEAELRAEEAAKGKAEEFNVDRMLANLSVKLKRGDAVAEHYAKTYAGRVQSWEQKASAILAALDSGGDSNIPPELATIITNWAKRLSEVTTDTTVTSGKIE
jgi:hypothetical protein